MPEGLGDHAMVGTVHHEGHWRLRLEKIQNLIERLTTDKFRSLNRDHADHDGKAGSLRRPGGGVELIKCPHRFY